MSSFFEPNYTVLTFLFVKKFLFLEVIALLAFLRLAQLQAVFVQLGTLNGDPNQFPDGL